MTGNVVVAVEEKGSGAGVSLMTSRSMDLSALNNGTSSSPQHHSSRQQYVTSLHRSSHHPTILENLGPDLQNILRQSYDYLTIMPKLQSNYDGHLIYKTSCKECKAFLGCDSLAKS